MSIINKTIAALLGGLFATLLSASAAKADESVVSLPAPTLIPEPHSADADDSKMLFSQYFGNMVPLQLRRARNLLAARHYGEAIQDYIAAMKHISRWPDQWTSKFEAECGFAFEMTGENEKALHFYAISEYYGRQLWPRLLIKLGRYEEALKLVNAAIDSQRILEEKQGQTGHELCELLRLRAAAYAGLKNDQAAVQDLSEATKKYLVDDSTNANICIKEANILIQRSVLGEPLSIKPSDQPAHGRDKAVQLLQFLATAKDPFSITHLNALTGAHIKLPSSPFPNFYQEQQVSWYRNMEYTGHLESDGPKLTLYIDTNKCCVDKESVLQVIRIPPASSLSADGSRWLIPSVAIVEWNLSTGTLKLTFGLSGFKVLERIEMLSPDWLSKPTAQDLWDRGQAAAMRREFENAVSCYSESLSLGNISPALYVDRAHAFIGLHQYDDAIADAMTAVKLGGRPYLEDRAAIEADIGQNDKSIADLKEYFGKRPVGPETCPLWLKLADLYLKEHQYKQALEAAENALFPSEYETQALFLKAKAEAGLNENDCALRDGKAASLKFFETASIVRRDEVDTWLKTISSDQSWLGAGREQR